MLLGPCDLPLIMRAAMCSRSTRLPREHTPLDTTPPAATLDEQLEGLPHEVAVDMLSFVLLDEDSEVACA